MPNWCSVSINLTFIQERPMQIAVIDLCAKILEACSKDEGADIGADRCLFDGHISMDSTKFTITLTGEVKWGLDMFDIYKLKTTYEGQLESIETNEMEEGNCVYGQRGWNRHTGLYTCCMLQDEHWPEPQEGVDMDEDGNIYDSWYDDYDQRLEDSLKQHGREVTMTEDQLLADNKAYVDYLNKLKEQIPVTGTEEGK